MANNQTFTTTFILNTQQAHERIEELDRIVKNFRAASQKALAEGNKAEAAKLEKAARDAEKELRALQTRTQAIDNVMAGLSTSNLKDIRTTIKAINKELNSGDIKRGSKEWDAYQQKLKECNAELKKIKQEQQPDDDGGKESIFDKGINLLNKNWGAISQIWSSVTGLSDTVQQCTQAFLDWDESMANVTKYTGQTKEEVRAMNEEFSKMDTRTSIEQLNELAGAAGRLGIQSHDEIMEFVDAADKINVALGDDLGEGAVDNIGKLAQTFGEIDRLGMRKALLSTGSAINEVAQSSSAGAGYLVDFTARLAGIGKQAGMTQTQIMGFGAALDESMLRDETAATALTNLIAKMATDSAKFAKIAGLNVTEFSQKVKTDMNGALIELFEKLGQQGGLSKLAPMLADMKLNGSQATQVLATLADKIGRVKEMQEKANDAYQAGTSVIDEYKVQNSTMQAQVDKANKEFLQLTRNLGEQLLPIVKYSSNAASLFVRVLSTLIGFIGRHKTAIISLTVAITAFRLEQLLRNKESKLSIALTKAMAVADTAWAKIKDLLTGKIKLATIAQKALNLATKAYPVAFIISAILAVITLIVELTDKNRNLTAAQRAQLAAQKDLADVQKQAAADANTELSRVKSLYAVAMNKANADYVRKRALEELHKISPQYFSDLDLETINTNKAARALTTYSNALIANAKVKAIANKIADLETKKADLKIDDVKHWYDHLSAFINSAINNFASIPNMIKSSLALGRIDPIIGLFMPNAFNKAYDLTAEGIAQSRYNAQINEINEEEKALKKFMKEALADSMKYPVIEDYGGGDYGSGGSGSAEQIKKEDIARRKAEIEQKKREAAALKAKIEADKAEKAEANKQLADLADKYSRGLIDYRKFLDEREKLQLDSIKRRKAIYGEESNEAKQLADDEIKIREKKAEALKKLNQDEIERERLKKEYLLKEQYVTKGSDIYANEDALNEALFMNDMAAMQKRIDMEAAGSEEWLSLKSDMEKKQLDHQHEMEMNTLKRINEARTEYMKIDGADKLAMEEKFWQKMKEQGLINATEYEKIITGVRLKYAKRTPTADEQTRQGASASLSKAEELAGPAPQIQSGGDDMGVTAFAGIFKIVEYRRKVNDQLKQLYGDDYKNAAEYQEAQRQNSQAMFEQIVSAANAAYSGISNIMNAASAYAQACSQLETARITADYDKQIEAAGKNSKKKERLEKERDKKLAAAKTKANRKAMKIEIAQAFASTAMAAINAYASASKEHWLLGAVAAAMATAAGMMQIATIKKQHQAEEAGYYEGGFTGGSNYRREAGVVHEGEFVANHRAVANTAILPALQLIDTAQRNNTIANLTAADVSRAVGVGSTTVVSAPTVNVVNDNDDVRQTLSHVSDVLQQLQSKLDDGIVAVASIDGEMGIARQLKRYNQLLNNK